MLLGLSDDGAEESDDDGILFKSRGDDDREGSGGSSSESSSSSSVSDGDTSKWVSLEGGAKLKVDAYTPKGGSKYVRWVMKCSRHPKCYKKRSVSHKNCSTFGSLEPVAYLVAWEQMEHTDVDYLHNVRRPSAVAVRDWAGAQSSAFIAKYNLKLVEPKA